MNREALPRSDRMHKEAAEQIAADGVPVDL